MAQRGTGQVLLTLSMPLCRWEEWDKKRDAIILQTLHCAVFTWQWEELPFLLPWLEGDSPGLYYSDGQEPERRKRKRQASVSDGAGSSGKKNSVTLCGQKVWFWALSYRWKEEEEEEKEKENLEERLPRDFILTFFPLLDSASALLRLPHQHPSSVLEDRRISGAVKISMLFCWRGCNPSFYHSILCAVKKKS